MNTILRNSALVLFGAAFALWLCWCAGLRVNLTPSLPLGIYRVCPGAPGKGDTVSFCLNGEFAELARERGYLQAGSCPSGLRPLLKKAAALPGDVIPDLGIRAVDSLNRPLPSVALEKIVPPGMAFLLADHPGSFDSRYFGLVPLASLQKTEPVFIFNPKQGELP